MRKQQLSDSSFSCLKVRGVLWFRKINATKAKSKTESRSVQMDNIQSEANQNVGKPQRQPQWRRLQAVAVVAAGQVG